MTILDSIPKGADVKFTSADGSATFTINESSRMVRDDVRRGSLAAFKGPDGWHWLKHPRGRSGPIHGATEADQNEAYEESAAGVRKRWAEACVTAAAQGNEPELPTFLMSPNAGPPSRRT